MGLRAIEQMNETVAAYNALRDKAEGILTDAFKELFEKYPEIASVGWVQYAPHFNDGDACVFGVHEPAVKLAPALAVRLEAGEALDSSGGVVAERAEPDEDSGHYEDDSDLWAIRRREWASPKGAEPTAYERSLVEAVREIFAVPDDFFESAFGSDAKVIATPLAIKTFGYSHD